jgi:hypothetical protein
MWRSQELVVSGSLQIVGSGPSQEQLNRIAGRLLQARQAAAAETAGRRHGDDETRRQRFSALSRGDRDRDGDACRPDGDGAPGHALFVFSTWARDRDQIEG